MTGAHPGLLTNEKRNAWELYRYWQPEPVGKSRKEKDDQRTDFVQTFEYIQTRKYTDTTSNN